MNIKLLLLWAPMLALLISLGFWQLQRALQKQQLLAEAERSNALPASAWAEHLASGRLVQLEGEFKPAKYWLLDNQIKRGRVGFDVIMPFVSGDQTILVNRGWVAGDPGRRTLPRFNTPAGPVQISARVYRPHKPKQPSLAQDGHWPRIIGRLGLADMAADIGLAQTPASMLRLQQHSPGALQSGWPAVNMSPAKHRAYALQWFAMALALLVLSAVYGSNLPAYLAAKIGDKKEI